jgi:hypothetical protein
MSLPIATLPWEIDDIGSPLVLINASPVSGSSRSGEIAAARRLPELTRARCRLETLEDRCVLTITSDTVFTIRAKGRGIMAG